MFWTRQDTTPGGLRSFSFRWGEQRIGARIASLVIAVVLLSSLAPGLVTALLAVQSINQLRNNVASNHLEVLTARFEQVMEYLGHLPGSVLRVYNLSELPWSSEGTIRKRVEDLRKILEGQILPMQLLDEMSLLSAELGGRELLRIKWADGVPSVYETETLNSASNIPYFLRTLHREQKPSFLFQKYGRYANASSSFWVRVAIGLTDNEGAHTGVLEIKCDLSDWFAENFDRSSDEQHVFVADASGKVLFSNGPDGMYFYPQMHLLRLWPGLTRGEITHLRELKTFQSHDALMALRPVMLDPDEPADSHNRYLIGFISPAGSTLYENRKFLIPIILFTLAVTILSAFGVGRLTLPIVQVSRLAQRLVDGETRVEDLERRANSPETRILTEALRSM